MPGFSTFKRNRRHPDLSPNANVFYHADIQGQSLWQIEGSKSVYIYPRSEIFIKPQNIEKILLRETSGRTCPTRSGSTTMRASSELKPGEMVTWQLYAPHRVHNHDCLNISRDHGALDQADLELLRGALRQRRVSPHAGAEEHLDQGSRPATSIRRQARPCFGRSSASRSTAMR